MPANFWFLCCRTIFALLLFGTPAAAQDAQALWQTLHQPNLDPSKSARVKNLTANEDILAEVKQ
jgi:P pilus assembly chaperone PapD